VKLARLRRAKITCSLSYKDYVPKTNAVILLDISDTQIENISTEK
jgi:hypothetical protein